MGELISRDGTPESIRQEKNSPEMKEPLKMQRPLWEALINFLAAIDEKNQKAETPAADTDEAPTE